MKKAIPMMSLLTMMLFSCGGQTSSSVVSTSVSPSTTQASSETVSSISMTASNDLVDFSDLKYICPSGAPSVAFYNYSDNQNFETNGTPSNIVACMTKASDYDVVVIDTVSGVKAINNGAPYELAANITLGNFFIASTGHDDDGVMDSDDKIVLFGQNQTPDYIFHYIYGDEFNSAIEYVTAVKDAATCLASGKNVSTGSDVDYVFIAQPVLFATLNNQSAATYGQASVYANIQDLYKAKSGNLSLIQASIFVKKDSDARKIDSFLVSIAQDIQNAIDNPDCIVEPMNRIGEEESKALYGIAANVAKATLKDNNSLGLGYVDALENKDAIDQFLSLFSMETTNEEIYHQ